MTSDSLSLKGPSAETIAVNPPCKKASAETCRVEIINDRSLTCTASMESEHKEDMLYLVIMCNAQGKHIVCF